jgi:hypothetical protein
VNDTDLFISHGLTLEGVGHWAAPGEHFCRVMAADERIFMARYVGAIAAALILGIELGRACADQ